MDECQYQYCMKCRSSEHHTIECVVGERPIDYKVIANQSSTLLTQADINTQVDLINFDEEDDFAGTQSSHTDCRSDLQGLSIGLVNQGFGPELSPATPNYEASFQEDMDEAIRRSLQDAKIIAPKEEEMLLSDGEESEKLHKSSVEKVKGWIAGDKFTVNSIERNPLHHLDDPSQWETKSTPKARKNRESLPKSSFLTLQDNEQTSRGRQRLMDNKKTFAEAVTRTFNPEANTMVVGNLRQKRRGRGNQRSYIDITSELQYLR